MNSLCMHVLFLKNLKVFSYSKAIVGELIQTFPPTLNNARIHYRFVHIYIWVLSQKFCHIPGTTINLPLYIPLFSPDTERVTGWVSPLVTASRETDGSDALYSGFGRWVVRTEGKSGKMNSIHFTLRQIMGYRLTAHS